MATSEPIDGTEKSDQLQIAAEILYSDYLNDPELTAFSVLDGEDFETSVD